MTDFSTKVALIGCLGIAAQWLAWQFRLPAIVLLSAAGILAGPVFGIIDPQADFGDLLRPIIGLAVAVILFEGGLSLNFREISETSTAVRRLVFLGAPIAWALGSLFAHHVAGLGWPAALILSGIFVVTGPTVIMPLLRNARLEKRPASLLRWEAIIADPLGALFAVLAFELFLVFGTGEHDLIHVLVRFAVAMPIAILGGWYLGKLIVAIFVRGYVAEFLKAPIIMMAVLGVYATTNLFLEESGLLAVTAMGIAIGNSRIASLSELRRFKEVITVLLVSGVFVLLTATLDPAALLALTLNDYAYILLLLVVVRPVSVWVSTIGAGLSFKERLLVGWIAPRGIVAVAVAGLFGAALTGMNNPDGARMVSLTFAVVFITMVLHGFSLRPFAKLLDLSAHEAPGLLIVGGNPWSVALAQALARIDVPVTIADRNFSHLRGARYAGVTVYHGEILSEVREHKLDLNDFSHLVAATDNDAYNALVCMEMSHEFGRSNVLQLAAEDDGKSENQAMSFTVGGRRLFKDPIDADTAIRLIYDGYAIQTTEIKDSYRIEAYLADRPEKARVFAKVSRDGAIEFASRQEIAKAEVGDRLLSFGPTQTKQQEKSA